jgi:hypothetical protein
MATTHNLHTYIKATSKAVACNPTSGDTYTLHRGTVIDYVSAEGSQQASNGAIVVNPAAADDNAIVIVFTHGEEDKTIVPSAQSALYEIREAARLAEIAELEARLAELRAKG